MRESENGMKGDHRILSDPSTERKEFIKHVAENAANDEKKEAKEANKEVKENEQKH